jgi:hypothetical protein
MLAVFGVSAAYILKVCLSGSSLNHIKLYFCLIFNGAFVIPYIDIIKNNDFLFLGYRPDIISDHPFVGWLAFACIFAHLFALPVKWKIK